MPELVAPAFDHHQRSDWSFGEIFTDDLVGPAVSGELRPQAAAIERCRIPRYAAGEFAQGRENIDQRGRLFHAPRGETSRCMHDQWNAAGRLEEVHFVPKTALA